MLGGGRVLTSTVDGLVVVVDGGYFNVGGGGGSINIHGRWACSSC